ncbi:MAG: TA system VapC family ribonuclease toxin [Verrucomicrobiota bacterium]
MKAKTVSLVDVNVLLALLHERHLFSEEATAWLGNRESNDSVAIARIVQMGVLRILTRPSIMGEDVLAPADFWKGWSVLMEDGRFFSVPEPSRLEVVWRETTSSLPAGQCAETDAYLAAFASAGEYRLSTFDKGFSRYAGLDWELID